MLSSTYTYVAESPKIEPYGPVAPERVQTTDPLFNSCIRTARWLGVPVPYGTDAVDIKASGPPTVGGLVLFSYPKADHVAKISVLGAEEMLIQEGNFVKGEYTERWVPYTDPRIRGYRYYPLDTETPHDTLIERSN